MKNAKLRHSLIFLFTFFILHFINDLRSDPFVSENFQ